MRRIETRRVQVVCAATLSLILLTSGMVSAKAPRRGKAKARAHRAPVTKTIRVLERGVAMPLVLDEARLREEKAALRGVIDRAEPVVITVPPEAIRPSDSVFTMLLETETGFPLVLELSLRDFDLRSVPGTLEVYIDTLDNLVVREGINDLRNISPVELPSVMTTAEANTLYFCQRRDGAGGSIVRGTIGVAYDGAFAEIPVSLRRDAFQQPGMRTLSASVTQGGKKKKKGGTWGLSWFSDDCTETKKGKCRQNECEITLSSVLKLAKRYGIDVPGGATVEVVLELLEEHGFSVGGQCSRAYFLGFIDVGCQCFFFTLGGSDSADAGGIDSSK